MRFALVLPRTCSKCEAVTCFVRIWHCPVAVDLTSEIGNPSFDFQ